MQEGEQESTQEETWQFKPGDTISPNTPSAPAQPSLSSARTEALPETQTPAPVVDESSLPEQAPAVSTAIPPTGADGSITWTASEFIAHSKSAGWYLTLGGVAAVVAFLIWLVTKDVISAAVVVVGALALGVYGARQPRQLEYGINDQGVQAGQRFHPFGEFRSFSVIQEGAFSSINLYPLKRFAPLLTIYYDPADEDKIVALLADRLPIEHRQQDLIDRIMWHIRF